MNKRTIEAMRRCDRAFAGVLFIAAATTISASALAPYTDKMAQSSYMEAAAAPAPVDQQNIVRASLPAQPVTTAIEQLQDERRCMAEALYYEARGEGALGQAAIAEVIYDRMRSGEYPNSICGVVYEGAQERHACQFSFVCNGEMERPKNPHEWARARSLAAKIMTGVIRVGDITDGATSYHSVDVDPVWSETMERTVQIGNHVFYRRLARGSTRT